jgi:hypothetical protein
MNNDQNDCQQFYFITPRFSDPFKHIKTKSWRRCRLYFRGRMPCWWIFDFETNYMYSRDTFLNHSSNKLLDSEKLKVRLKFFKLSFRKHSWVKVHELFCYFTTYLLNINAFLSLENKVTLGLRFLVAISFCRTFSSDIPTRQFQI